MIRPFNKAMKHILPYYDIAVTEIPRLMVEEDIISALKV